MNQSPSRSSLVERARRAIPGLVEGRWVAAAVLVVLSIACTGARGQQSVRLFLDPAGVGAGQSRPNPDWTLSSSNPVVAGGGRLYLYLAFGGSAQRFTTISFNVRVTGTGRVNAWEFYNAVLPGSGDTRWDVTSNTSGATPTTLISNVQLVATGKQGAANTPAAAATDTALFRSAAADGGAGAGGVMATAYGTTLLGYIDVAHTGGASSATVNIEIGSLGIVREGRTSPDSVLLGFGDAAVADNALGATSTTADATIAPIATFAEVEPNDSRAKADIIQQITPGATITGTTTGSSGTGATSPDYFFVYTAPMPPAIYRHRLTMAPTGTAHSMTLRGRAQVNGQPSTADVLLQAATGTTKINQWYGFGRRGGVFVAVTGTAATTAPYTLVYDRTVVTPVDIGTYRSGSISITTVGQGHSTDTELFVLNGNLDPISGASNDQSISPIVAQSTLTRTYPPGVYYLAVSDWNSAWNLGAPADDADRSNNLAEFSDTMVCGSNLFPAALNFAITDATGAARAFTASKNEAQEIRWFTFTVVPGACGLADVTGVGGPPTAPDGLLTGDDFVAFVNAFAAGCP